MDTMDHRTNLISKVPHTPASAQAETVLSGTNSEEKTSKLTKHFRRCLGEHERKIVASKRGKVCRTCRERKVKCNHISVFKDDVSSLPTTQESNRRLQDALGFKDVNRPMNTNDKRWMMFTPQDFVPTPSKDRSLKRKGPFSGSERSREKRRTPPDPEVQYGPTVKRATGSRWNAVQGVFHLTQTDSDVSTGINTGAMTSIGPQHPYLGNQLPMGDAMTLFSTSPFENNTAICAASVSYSACDANESHFDLQIAHRPQPFSADQRRHKAFGFFQQGSEPIAGLEDESIQHLAPSSSEIQLAPQAPELSDMIPAHREAYHPLYDFNDASFQTPSNRDVTPSLSFTLSTIESQGQDTVTSQSLIDTPSHKTARGQEELDVL